MTRAEFMKVCLDAESGKYLISESELDEISSQCDCADAEGNYIPSAIEAFFDCKILMEQNPNACFPGCEILF